MESLNNHDDLKLTLYLQNESEVVFPNNKKSHYSLNYKNISYQIRNDASVYSEYLFQYFEINSQ